MLDNFSKKQVMPILSKYNVSLDDTVFKSIVALFPGQNNYQIWALKCVYGEHVSLQIITHIHDWITSNSSHIQFLKLGNIVAYKTKDLIQSLFDEMEGVTRYQVVKQAAFMFNTHQRNLLIEALITPIRNAEDAIHSAELGSWYTIFCKFNKLSSTKKNNIIRTASAIATLNGEDGRVGLKQHLYGIMLERYEWIKEELLSFRAIQTPTASVVYDKGNIVILQVKTFADSRTLCGSGRTGWCLTRDESYFRQYVSSKDNKQYFYFDFGLREDNELAHIGFTTTKSGKITNAHSTSNANMMGDGIRVGNSRCSVHDVLRKNNIPMETFISICEPSNYKWMASSFVSFFDANKSSLADKPSIVYAKNGIVVVKTESETPNTSIHFDSLIPLYDFTLMDTTELRRGLKNEISEAYFIYNFNVEFKNNMSFTVLAYTKDIYGAASLAKSSDVYGRSIPSIDDRLKELNITRSDFESQADIDPAILVCKFINEDNEREAIRILKSSESVNVNTKFQNRLLVMRAIDAYMPKLYGEIIRHKTFDAKTINSLGGSCLHTLAIVNGVMNAKVEDATRAAAIKQMIEESLHANVFDLNARDINLDTLLHLAACNETLTWLALELIQDYRVNINLVNDILETPLTRALRMKNMVVIKALGERPDLEISQEDRAIAQKKGIDLDAIIDPRKVTAEEHKVLQETNKDNASLNEIGDRNLADELRELFSEAFS